MCTCLCLCIVSIARGEREWILTILQMGWGEVEEFFRWEGGLDRKEMVNF